jgi:hypothetical protein
VRGVLLAAMLSMFLVAVTHERNAGFLRTYSYITFIFELLCVACLFLSSLFPSNRWLACGGAISFEVSLPHALTVTLAYWLLIAKPNNWALSEFRMFFVHGLNFVVLLLEFAADRLVFVPSHIFAVVFLDALYFLAILLPVQLVSGSPVYPGLTSFDRPAVFVAVAFGIPICNALFFFGFLLLSFSKSKCGDKLPLQLFRRAKRDGDVELQTL